MTEEEKFVEFEKELAQLINKYSFENLSNTPDFILSRHLRNELVCFSFTSMEREKWFGKSLTISSEP